MKFLGLMATLGISISLFGCASNKNDTGPMSIAEQGSFFVGGKNIKSNSVSNLPIYSSSGTIAVDQVYVHYQKPTDAKNTSVVLIHGCCLTGKTWESTPDGRMGWDELFLRNGFSTYVVDQASRGRSAVDTSTVIAAKGGRLPPKQLPMVNNVSQEDAWEVFRFGPKYPEVYPGMQFPLDAQAEFWKQMVPDWIRALPTPTPTVPALSELAQKINGAVLVSHSQSGIFPFQTAKLNPAGIRAIVSIEPGACPAADEDLSYLKGLPVLVLWGDNVNKSPRWAPRLKACKEFVAAANKAGIKAQNVMLSDLGMPGASHMLMQDKNSIQIGKWLIGWINQNVKS